MAQPAPPQQIPRPTLEEKLAEWEHQRDLALRRRTAVYISTPITTGERFLAWFREVGRNLRRDSREYQVALRSDVVLANVQRAAQFIELLRWRHVGLIIDPTTLDVPGWDQATYQEFWRCVIERHVRRVVFLSGWQLSHGCTLEYETAQRLGLDCVDEDLRPLPLGQGLARIETAEAEARTIGLDTSYLLEILARLRSGAKYGTWDTQRELHKDEVLDHLANTANVAQFVSFSPALQQRHCRIRGLEPNHPFPTLEQAVLALFERSPERAVNIRSYNPQRPEGNPFLYGLKDVASTVDELRRLSQEGLFTIVNETIDQSDGGVSGVSYRGILEFAPDATPRCVDDPDVETAALPFELGMALLGMVYGFEPDLRGREGARVEFSIHPQPRGWMGGHTVLWQSEQRPARTLRAEVQWPSRFSRFLGDKAFGLAIAVAAGLRVPRAVAFGRRFFPFAFGEATGTGDLWVRPCPEVKTPGYYPSVREWIDPMAVLRDWTVLDSALRLERRDAAVPQLAAVLVQEAVNAEYSGRAILDSVGTCEIEGTRGNGDAFMVGDSGPEVLPRDVRNSVAAVVAQAYEAFGPVQVEWVCHDGTAWIVQLNQARKGIAEPPTEPVDWVRFRFLKGRLEEFRKTVSALSGTGRGVIVVGNVSPLSHVGEIAELYGVPVQFVRD